MCSTLVPSRGNKWDAFSTRQLCPLVRLDNLVAVPSKLMRCSFHSTAPPVESRQLVRSYKLWKVFFHLCHVDSIGHNWTFFSRKRNSIIQGSLILKERLTLGSQKNAYVKISCKSLWRNGNSPPEHNSLNSVRRLTCSKLKCYTQCASEEKTLVPQKEVSPTLFPGSLSYPSSDPGWVWSRVSQNLGDYKQTIWGRGG